MQRGLGRHLTEMHPPIFVRELRDAERAQLEASLRAASAFTVRRAQIVLLSASGQPPRAISAGLCCARQTVRNAIRAWAMTQGHEVIGRPFENYVNGVDAAFTADGEYEVFWTVKQ